MAIVERLLQYRTAWTHAIELRMVPPGCDGSSLESLRNCKRPNWVLHVPLYTAFVLSFTDNNAVLTFEQWRGGGET